MRSLWSFTLLAMICLAAAALAGCGGMSSGLTTSGVPQIEDTSIITLSEPITMVFLRPLDATTIIGNIAVTAGGSPEDFAFDLQDEGYKLVILPAPEWTAGSQLIVRIRGGADGVHYTDGRTFNTFELVYYTGQ